MGTLTIGRRTLTADACVVTFQASRDGRRPVPRRDHVPRLGAPRGGRVRHRHVRRRGPWTRRRSPATATARPASGPPTSKGVEAGAEYKFTIRTPDGDLSRIDPYARQVTTSVGNAVVYDNTAFDWGDDDFQQPGWDDLVIYELHVGTFAGTADKRGTFDLAAKRLRVPAQARRVGRAGDAPVRVRRRHQLGLQPGPHVRDRELVRRSGRVQAVHPRRPCARDRRHRRRRLQPHRAVGPRPVAVRRLVRGRRRRDLLLQRRARADAVGHDPSRLRPRRGPVLPPRQRADLARGVPVRRPAVRRDRAHPDDRRAGHARDRARAGRSWPGSTTRSTRASRGS